MNEEEIRNLFKGKLQHLSKEQLIDHLVDISMAMPAINISTDLKSAINYQQVDASFATLQQPLGDLTKMQ